MNDLEQRIYRAATKAAAEVTTADIPPLRLSRAGRRSSGRRMASPRAMQWTGTGRGAVTKRILAPIAAAASVVILIVVVITVGHGSPGGARHIRPPAAPAGPSAAERALGAEALNWYFPASGATYTAGLAFAYTQAKVTAHDIDRCLARAGFPQPPFRGSQRLYQLSFANDSQFPDLAQLAAHPGDHSSTKPFLVLRHPTAARQKALARAQARCTARYAQGLTRVDKAASALQGAWLGIISAIEHSRPVTATQPAFARCLESHGVPASLATRTVHASNPLFYGYFSWADSTNQAAATTRQLAADERHERRVFLACAPPVVSVVEKMQLTRRGQFFRQHAGQIKRIVRLAEEMRGRTH